MANGINQDKVSVGFAALEALDAQVRGLMIQRDVLAEKVGAVGQGSSGGGGGGGGGGVGPGAESEPGAKRKIAEVGAEGVDPKKPKGSGGPGPPGAEGANLKKLKGPGEVGLPEDEDEDGGEGAEGANAVMDGCADIRDPNCLFRGDGEKALFYPDPVSAADEALLARAASKKAELAKEYGFEGVELERAYQIFVVTEEKSKRTGNVVCEIGDSKTWCVCIGAAKMNPADLHERFGELDTVCDKFIKIRSDFDIFLAFHAKLADSKNQARAQLLFRKLEIGIRDKVLKLKTGRGKLTLDDLADKEVLDELNGFYIFDPLSAEPPEEVLLKNVDSRKVRLNCGSREALGVTFLQLFEDVNVNNTLALTLPNKEGGEPQVFCFESDAEGNEGVMHTAILPLEVKSAQVLKRIFPNSVNGSKKDGKWLLLGSSSLDFLYSLYLPQGNVEEVDFSLFRKLTPGVKVFILVEEERACSFFLNVNRYMKDVRVAKMVSKKVFIFSGSWGPASDPLFPAKYLSSKKVQGIIKHRRTTGESERSRGEVKRFTAAHPTFSLERMWKKDVAEAPKKSLRVEVGSSDYGLGGNSYTEDEEALF